MLLVDVRKKELAVVQQPNPISGRDCGAIGPARRIHGRLREISSTCGCKAFTNNRTARLGSGGSRVGKQSVGERSISGLQARNRRYFGKNVASELESICVPWKQVSQSTQNIVGKVGEASFVPLMKTCLTIIDDKQVTIQACRSLTSQSCFGKQAR
ncbi:hypothetical protein MCOR31_002482 [Pyricularia oryzae]|nr:hypothetical protein MCOR30_000238 [Pyricularia oryzae]KAI6374889.1 hypothetical protein MCOR31_002482 [Pyricularia oryzae]KAI6621420.1 hypothetical protein MCOR08_008430 [Pyricularia oryzae]